jgi:hypothetical protein
MIITIKYFHEKNDLDFENYDKLWVENHDSFVYLQTNLSDMQQINILINQLNDNKDISVVRFPTISQNTQNKIINNILLGKGFKYENDKIWYPKEIWIYNPFK